MIVVTGATGKLGRHVVEALLEKIPAGEIVAAVRDIEKAADLAELGVVVRQADYSKPETLTAAFAGANKVLLISSNNIEGRIPEHQNVIAAAKQAGVTLLAYTGILKVDTATSKLAEDHHKTEELIRESGVPFTFLRNGWYLENHTEQIGMVLQHGAFVGAAGDGRFSAASRADYAAAASAVLTGAGHEGKAYELAGDTSHTYAELAAEVSKQSGKTVVYNYLPEAEYAGLLTSFGLPAQLAAILADADAKAAEGELESSAKDLHALVGRSTQTLAEAVKAQL